MLALDFEVCESNDCLSIQFSETTGLYDITSNVGGWSSPNPSIGNITSATLTILFPYNSSIQTVVIPSSLLYPTFPTTSSTTAYTIDSSTLAIGNGLQLPDGLYTFTYQVVGSEGTFTKIKYILLSCQVKCCVSKLLAQVPTCDCDCDSELIETAIMAKFWLDALCAAGQCGNTTAVNEILDILDRYCDWSSCNCS